MTSKVVTTGCPGLRPQLDREIPAAFLCESEDGLSYRPRILRKHLKDRRFLCGLFCLRIKQRS